MSWLVRIYRYDGSDSTIQYHTNREDAERMAAGLNAETQSDQYRAEEYDTPKAAQFFKVTDGGLRRVGK